MPSFLLDSFAGKRRGLCSPRPVDRVRPLWWRSSILHAGTSSAFSSLCAFKSIFVVERCLHTSGSSPAKLTHTDSGGEACMVDVSDKATTRRSAMAEATVLLGEEVFALVQDNSLKKGDVLAVARLAGIMAAKQTSSLIPLCHPLPLSHVVVDLVMDEDLKAVRVQTQATTTAQTGVEMEALTAAAVSALTVYDMCKAASKDIIITNVQLVAKSGGLSGNYFRPASS